MQMTVAQNLKATGAVVVTTPQDVALADVERAIGMFNIPALKTKILGIVENMSVFVCPHCGKETHIFLSGGGIKAAEKYGVPFLGKIPLEVSIPESGDSGVPVLVRDPEGPVAAHFMTIAQNLVRGLHHVTV
ncbi:MAG: P-loop NTPase [Planctomycetota bacterium]